MVASLFRLQPSKRLSISNLVDWGYQSGRVPEQESLTVVSAEKRALIIPGLAADLEYSFSIEAYRSVDQDISITGLLKSALIQYGQNPYTPQKSISIPWTSIGGANKPEDGATRNVNRGDWTSGATYQSGDIVSLNGSSWACSTLHVASGVNQPPTLPTTSNTWWKLLASIGNSTPYAVLTNDSHTIPTDINGSNGNYTGASSTLIVYLGTTDDSANWTVAATVSTSSGVATVTGSLVGKTYTVTGLTADSGYVDLVASRSGYPSISKRFTLTKNKAGSVGSDATAYWLVVDSPIIAKDKSGNVTPSAIVCSAKKQTGTGSPADYSGIFKVYLNGSGTASYTSSPAEATTTRPISSGTTSFKVELWNAANTLKLDEQLVSVVSDGADGAASTVPGPTGPAAVSGILTNESIVFAADSAGTVSAATFTSFGGGTFKIIEGTTDKTGTGTTYSVNASTNCTVSINASTGVYSVTALSADTGSAVLRCIYSGVTIDKTLALAKSKQGNDSTTYGLVVSTTNLKKTVAGVLSPSTITLSALSKVGTAAPSNYTGRYKVYEDGVLKYTSAANELSKVYTPSTSSVSTILVELYLAGGTTTLLDSQTVIVVADGASGTAAVSSTLSAASVTLNANNLGVVSDYTPGVTTMSVFLGTTDDSANWTFSRVNSTFEDHTNAPYYAFTNTLANCTVTNATTTLNSSYVTLTATATGPNIRTPTVSIDGATFTNVLVKCRRVAGSGWDGKCYYTTGSHGESESYKKVIAQPVELTTPGTWAVVQFDMSNLTAGGTDWTTSSITKVRLNLGSSSSDIFDIEYIAFGADAVVSSLNGNVLSVSNLRNTSAYVDITATRGGYATQVKRFSLSKSVKGDSGVRGSRQFYIGDLTAWSDSTATAAVQPSGGPIENDTVTQYGPTFPGGSMTKIWTGTAWSQIVMVIDGSLLVNGSVRTQALSATDIYTMNIKSSNFSATNKTGWSIDQTGYAEINNLKARGEINVGDFNGYAWPATGNGLHLSKFGFIAGNPNNGGKYFQIETPTDGGPAAIYTNIPAYIEDLQVGTAKLANASITNGKIANLAVDTIKIADNAVSVTNFVTGTAPTISTTLTVPSGETWKIQAIAHQDGFALAGGASGSTAVAIGIDGDYKSVTGVVVGVLYYDGDGGVNGGSSFYQALAGAHQKTVAGPKTITISFIGTDTIGKNLTVFGMKK